ncbi:cupin domain-containing protein [Noviherbaspirillum sp. UKPF54]|uniref:cupin domain-containing protein n=1 Tax=Noviherbaspirillum sp. UKPF54 TaxID=2601898 RepID=UPI0011B16706|nr:cupin domain-containing protein [Noviherbaspirillum sp. UKPF54]QDZ29152.1 cupin domain-containing protein [Noviherbaspirillum sp. UKPF54]
MLHHATSGELIDVRPLAEKLRQSMSTALLRTDDLEVMRLVLPADKSVPEHHVAGEITLLCLEGTVELQAHDKTQVLQAGRMIYLAGNVPYALRALEDASVLMTMLRKPE